MKGFFSLPREERAVQALVLGASLVCGVYLASHAKVGDNPLFAWVPAVSAYIEAVGFTFWIFLALVTTLLPYSLLTRDPGKLNTFMSAAVLTGSLGTVVGLQDSLRVLDQNSVKGVLACVPYLVQVFKSTEVGVGLAILTYCLALYAGIKLSE